jgi:predicted amidophosphoribosyltransferase
MMVIGPFELLIVLGVMGLLVVVIVVIVSTSKRQSTPANPNLFPCPDCGRHVSRLAKSCPNCGRPLASEGQK